VRSFSWESRNLQRVPVSEEKHSSVFARIADLLEHCLHELSFLLVDALLERAFNVGGKLVGAFGS